MSRYDSDYRARGAATGADAEGAERFVERNSLPLQVAAFYAVVLAAAVVARRAVSGPNVEVLLSILVWFAVIFAACTALLGGAVRLFGAVQRRRRSE